MLTFRRRLACNTPTSVAQLLSARRPSSLLLATSLYDEHVSPPPPLSLPQHPTLLGIAGPSGSGKTTLARTLARQLNATLFPLDLYYRDLSEFPLDARDKRNFDHPDSLESELLIAHLRSLAEGRPIQRPVYDFKTHTRVPNAFTTVEPTPYIVVEGILALHYPDLLPLYALSVYVDAPDELCLNRRIRRDIRDRGRTEASVREQYEAAVRPMAERYILPSRQSASFTVSGTEALERSAQRILDRLSAARQVA